MIDWNDFSLLVGYSSTRQLASMSYRNPFVSVPVSAGKAVIIERARAVADFELREEDCESYGKFFLIDGKRPDKRDKFTLWDELLPFEKGLQGLQDYF
jgi:hypothetical protein